MRQAILELIKQASHNTLLGMEEAVERYAPYNCGKIYIRPVANGTLYIQSGAPLIGISVLLSGDCSVFFTSQDGETHNVYTNSGFHIYGLSEYLCDNAVYSASIVASSPCLFAEMPSEAFMEALQSAEVTLPVLRYFAKLIENSIRSNMRRLLINDYEKLLLYLYEQSAGHPLPHRFNITRIQLSELLSIRLRTLYRYCDRAQEEGFVEMQAGKPTVNALCMERLASRAGLIYQKLL